MTKTNAYSFTGKAKVYVKDNLGSPFIAGFMSLLVVVAVALSAGLSSLANSISVYAYYLLIVGVILQIVSFLRFRKKDGKAA